jgi:hypothetical protein
VAHLLGAHPQRAVADDKAAIGEMRLTGDRALFDRFVGWFPLPEKIA